MVVYGFVVVMLLEGRNLFYGCLEDILSCDNLVLNCYSNDDKNVWFVIDLGFWVILLVYIFCYVCGYGRFVLRNWVF